MEAEDEEDWDEYFGDDDFDDVWDEEDWEPYVDLGDPYVVIGPDDDGPSALDDAMIEDAERDDAEPGEFPF